MSHTPHTHVLVTAIAEKLANDAELRMQVAGALASVYADVIGQPEANETVSDQGAHTSGALVTKVKADGKRIYVCVPIGHPVVKLDNRYYAHTPVGTVPVAKKLVTRGVTNSACERSVTLRKDNTWAVKIANGAPLVNQGADTDTHVPTDTHSTTTSKADKKATKAREREAKFVKLHNDALCTCTSTGHDCVACRDYGMTNRFDQ